MNSVVCKNVEELIHNLRRLHLTKINEHDEEKLNNVYFALSEYCPLKELNKSEDIPYNKEDFENVAHNCLPYLKCIKRVLEELVELGEDLSVFKPSTIRRIVLDAFIIASYFQNSDCCWSDEQCAAESLGILNSIVKLTKSNLLCNLLTGKEYGSVYMQTVYPSGILKLFVMHFSEKITQETWKKFPYYVEAYVWILHTLESPHLADYVSYLLPAALFILDDWEQRHKIIGIKALHHILLNTPQSEIRWYGRAEVIYEALKNHIYSPDHELLNCAYPALILASLVLENDPKKASIIKKSYFDGICGHLLREMSHEDKLALRSVFVKALKQLIEGMAIYAMRWSPNIMEVCSKYLETYEGEEAKDRRVILEVLQIYIKNCWPRVHAHSRDILKMVVRLLYDISSDEPFIQNKDELVAESKRVIQLLNTASPTMVSTLSEGINAAKIPQNKFLHFIFSEVK